jgi:hypothetical protein
MFRTPEITGSDTPDQKSSASDPTPSKPLHTSFPPFLSLFPHHESPLLHFLPRFRHRVARLPITNQSHSFPPPNRLLHSLKSTSARPHRSHHTRLAHSSDRPTQLPQFLASFSIFPTLFHPKRRRIRRAHVSPPPSGVDRPPLPLRPLPLLAHPLF